MLRLLQYPYLLNLFMFYFSIVTNMDMSMIENEIGPFLSRDARPDIRRITVKYFLGLTGSEEGCSLIASSCKYLSLIADLIDDEEKDIAKDSSLALINLATSVTTSAKLLELPSCNQFLSCLIGRIVSTDMDTVDLSCKLLSNLSRTESGAQRIADYLLHVESSQGLRLSELIELVTTNEVKLSYFAPVLLNLTQIGQVREMILNREQYVIQRLLPYVQFPVLKTRFSVVGVLKNCCFQIGKPKFCTCGSATLGTSS